MCAAVNFREAAECQYVFDKRPYESSPFDRFYSHNFIRDMKLLNILRIIKVIHT